MKKLGEYATLGARRPDEKVRRLVEKVWRLLNVTINAVA